MNVNSTVNTLSIVDGFRNFAKEVRRINRDFYMRQHNKTMIYLIQIRMMNGEWWPSLEQALSLDFFYGTAKDALKDWNDVLTKGYIGSDEYNITNQKRLVRGIVDKEVLSHG